MGDAWHWFDPDRAAAEVHRVLRPGGRLVLVWRAAAIPPLRGSRWPSACASCATTIPASWVEQGREGIDRHGGFSGWSHVTVPFTHATDRDGQLALLASASFVATLPEAEREELLEQARDQVPEGAIEAEYDAEVWRATRTA